MKIGTPSVRNSLPCLNQLQSPKPILESGTGPTSKISAPFNSACGRMSFSEPVETTPLFQQHSSNILSAPTSHSSLPTSHAIVHQHLYQQQHAAQQAAQQVVHHAAQQASHQTVHQTAQRHAPTSFVPHHMHLASSQPQRVPTPSPIPPQNHQHVHAQQQITPQPIRGGQQDGHSIPQSDQAQPSSHALPTLTTSLPQFGHVSEPLSHRDYEARPSPFQVMSGSGNHRIPASSSSIPQLLSTMKLGEGSVRRWGGSPSYAQPTLPEVTGHAASVGQNRTSGRDMRQYGEPAVRNFADDGGGGGGATNGDPISGQGILGSHWFGSVSGVVDPMPAPLPAPVHGVLGHEGESRGVIGGESISGVPSMSLGGSGVLHHGMGLAVGGGLGSEHHRSVLRDARSRIPLARPRFKPASEDEKRERHNKHTKQSRKRIDDRIKELKDALKKVRPNVKLGHKAEIVGEAVKFVLEMYNAQQTTQMMDSSLSN